MGKDLEQTFPLSVSLSWSTDLSSRSVAPLSRSQNKQKSLRIVVKKHEYFVFSPNKGKDNGKRLRTNLSFVCIFELVN